MPRFWVLKEIKRTGMSQDGSKSDTHFDAFMTENRLRSGRLKCFFLLKAEQLGILVSLEVLKRKVTVIVWLVWRADQEVGQFEMSLLYKSTYCNVRAPSVKRRIKTVAVMTSKSCSKYHNRKQLLTNILYELKLGRMETIFGWLNMYSLNLYFINFKSLKIKFQIF